MCPLQGDLLSVTFDPETATDPPYAYDEYCMCIYVDRLYNIRYRSTVDVLPCEVERASETLGKSLSICLVLVKKLCVMFY